MTLLACKTCKGRRTVNTVPCLRCKGTGIEPIGKRNKYNATAFVDENGERWHSKSEHQRWLDLKKLQKAGEISDLQRQVSIPLTCKGGMVGRVVLDFVYTEKGKKVYEDHKGGPIPALTKWKLRHLFLEHNFDVAIHRS